MAAISSRHCISNDRPKTIISFHAHQSSEPIISRFPDGISSLSTFVENSIKNFVVAVRTARWLGGSCRRDTHRVWSFAHPTVWPKINKYKRFLRYIFGARQHFNIAKHISGPRFALVRSSGRANTSQWPQVDRMEKPLTMQFLLLLSISSGVWMHWFRMSPFFSFFFFYSLSECHCAEWQSQPSSALRNNQIIINNAIETKIAIAKHRQIPNKQ